MPRTQVSNEELYLMLHQLCYTWFHIYPPGLGAQSIGPDTVMHLALHLKIDSSRIVHLIMDTMWSGAEMQNHWCLMEDHSCEYKCSEVTDKGQVRII